MSVTARLIIRSTNDDLDMDAATAAFADAVAGGPAGMRDGVTITLHAPTKVVRVEMLTRAFVGEDRGYWLRPRWLARTAYETILGAHVYYLNDMWDFAPDDILLPADYLLTPELAGKLDEAWNQLKPDAALADSSPWPDVSAEKDLTIIPPFEVSYHPYGSPGAGEDYDTWVTRTRKLWLDTQEGYRVYVEHGERVTPRSRAQIVEDDGVFTLEDLGETAEANTPRTARRQSNTPAATEATVKRPFLS